MKKSELDLIDVIFNENRKKHGIFLYVKGYHGTIDNELEALYTSTGEDGETLLCADETDYEYELRIPLSKIGLGVYKMGLSLKQAKEIIEDKKYE